MLRRALLLATALATFALMFSPAHAAKTTEDYVSAGTADVINECRDTSPTGMNIGAACLDIGAGKSLTIKVKDQAFASVGFYWSFEDANGDCAQTGTDPVLGETCESDGFACGSLTAITPPRTARVQISLDGPLFWALGCALEDGDSGPATIGTVTFTY